MITNKILPNSIIFVGIDNPIYINMGRDELMYMAGKASGKENLDNTFVFLDEIHYPKDWERRLKVLVDSYPQIKFIVSGSAAGAVLRVKSSDDEDVNIVETAIYAQWMHREKTCLHYAKWVERKEK